MASAGHTAAKMVSKVSDRAIHLGVHRKTVEQSSRVFLSV